MGLISKVGSGIKKFKNQLEKNINNKNSDGEDSVTEKASKKVKAAILSALITVFVIILGAFLIIVGAACILLIAVMVITDIISGIKDAITDFGSSVGNLLTTGCYGTDAECREQREGKAEQAFFDATSEIYNLYYVNSKNALTGDLSFKGKEDPYNENQTGYERVSYNPIVNIPVIVSTIMYDKNPEDGYYELLYGSTSIASQENELKVIGDNYLWYMDEKDIIGIDYDGIIAKSGTTSSNPCGNYDEIFLKAVAGETGYGELVQRYETDKSWWGGVINFFANTFTNINDQSKLRLLGKKTLSKNVVSSCIKNSSEKTGRTIKTMVRYEYNEENYKKFLIEDYLPDILTQNFYNDSFENWIYSKGYIRDEGIIYNADGSELSKKQSETLLDESKAYIKDLQKQNYKPSEQELEDAVDTILAASEYYEYILEDLMNNRGAVVKICSGVAVEVEGETTKSADGTEIPKTKTYELEALVAGFVQNLKNVYGQVPSNNVLSAAAIIYRSYILNATDFCNDTLSLSKIEDGKVGFKYVAPDTDITETIKDTRGKVIYVDGSMISSSYTTYDYVKYQQTYKGFQGIDISKIPTTYSSQIKLQDLQTIGDSNTLGKEKTVDDILIIYFTRYGEVTLKRVTGDLVGGQYASAAPLRTGGDSTEIQKAVDSSGTQIYKGSALNAGQCPWYAKYRAIEILTFSDMDATTKAAAINAIRNHGGDGAGWGSRSTLNKYFQVSDNLQDAKPGAIISWAGGIKCGYTYTDATGVPRDGYGHVGIVEKVNRDASGKVTSIVISDGWKKTPWESYSGWSGVQVNYSRTKSYDSTIHYFSNDKEYFFAGLVFLLG